MLKNFNLLYQTTVSTAQTPSSLIPDFVKSRVEHLLAASGEGSDHAVAIASRKLNWLMFVDPAWTKNRLVPMLNFEHPSSEPAWNGFLHSSKQPWPPLAVIIKPQLLKLLSYIEEFSWDRDLSKVAAQWLGVMRVARPDEPSGLSQGEMRSVLRAMSDETRNQFVFWLGRVGKDNEDGWVKHVIPLIDKDWPREQKYRTTASVRAWIHLLDDTGVNFPVVYEAVKKFLVPVDTGEYPVFQFTQQSGDQEPIAAMFPETMLDLMDRVTPQFLPRPPYELPNVLALIVEAESSLMSDPRYLRMVDLVERS